MKTEIRHVGIVVDDLEKCIEFWKQFFGFEIIIDQIEPSPYIDELLNLNIKKLRTVKLKNQGNALIELLKFQDIETRDNWSGRITSTGLTHIALTVNNLEELFNKLTNEGFLSYSKILVPPSKKVKVVFIEGPENLILELVEEIKL